MSDLPFDENEIVTISQLLLAAVGASRARDEVRYNALTAEALDRMEALDPGMHRVMWHINLTLIGSACHIGMQGDDTDWRLIATDMETGDVVNPDDRPEARPAVTAMRLMATYKNGDIDTCCALLQAAMVDEAAASEITWALARVVHLLAKDAGLIEGATA